jgi:hypothetical protein
MKGSVMTKHALAFLALALLLCGAPLGAQTKNELWANNGSSTLASGINSSTTSITVQTGHGARFPAPTGSQYFWVTLAEGATVEVVKCTSRSTDTLTCTRGQQSTSAASFTTSARVENRLTARTLSDIKDVIGPPAALTIDALGDNDTVTSLGTVGLTMGNTTSGTVGTPKQGPPGIQFAGSAYTTDTTGHGLTGLHTQTLTVEYAPSTAVNTVTNEPAGTLRWKFCYDTSNCRTPMWMISQGNLLMHSGLDTGMGGAGDISNSGNGAIYWRGCNPSCAAPTLSLTRAVMGSTTPGLWQLYGSNAAGGSGIGLELNPGEAEPTVSSCTNGAVASDSNNMAMRINVSGGNLGATCTINFSQAWTKVPVCVANTATASVAVKTGMSTTQVQLTTSGTVATGDVVNVICLGRF